MSAEQPSGTVEVLAVGAHPDDIEIGCGATLAGLRRRGSTIGLLHLTRGEAGTRGSAALREQEAERAAEILQAKTLDFLDCGDGSLRTGRAEEDSVIRVLRLRRPAVVLFPPVRDRHPDHGRAHRLVHDACYYAGLRSRQPEGPLELEPHRPALLLSYMLHDAFEPTIVVDVSRDFDTKLEVLAAYRSQLWNPARSCAGSTSELSAPDTHISSRRFYEALVGRARHFGLSIGADYGEPFATMGPVGVTDLRALGRSAPEAIRPGLERVGTTDEQR